MTGEALKVGVWLIGGRDCELEEEFEERGDVHEDGLLCMLERAQPRDVLRDVVRAFVSWSYDLKPSALTPIVLIPSGAALHHP